MAYVGRTGRRGNINSASAPQSTQFKIEAISTPQDTWPSTPLSITFSAAPLCCLPEHSLHSQLVLKSMAPTSLPTHTEHPLPPSQPPLHPLQNTQFHLLWLKPVYPKPHTPPPRNESVVLPPPPPHPTPTHTPSHTRSLTFSLSHFLCCLAEPLQGQFVLAHITNPIPPLSHTTRHVEGSSQSSPRPPPPTHTLSPPPHLFCCLP